MTDRITFSLHEPVQAKQGFNAAWMHAKALLMAGHRLTLEVRPEKRSDAQNRRLWSMLTDIAQQVEWHGQRLTAEDFKHMFTAALKKQRVVPGIDGGFVVLGTSTSKMTKAEMSELQEFMTAFGVERGVKFRSME